MKFAIHTLGCKINQYESNWIRENLIKGGLLEVDFKDKADVYIINTCTVTAEADRKSRQMARQAKNRNPEAKVIVTGCYANLNPEVFTDFEVVRDKKSIIPLLCGIFPENELIYSPLDRERFFIKVQDGCDKFCTYCRIPYARGHIVRSKPIYLVLKEISNAIENGYSEIVLTGINIGLYGRDNDLKLLDLLVAIESTNCNARFRISSIDPVDAYEILDFLRSSKKFVHHLHLSLQSGSDRILKLMNRNYTSSFFLNLLHKLRMIDPLYSVSTDIIVGFPSENEKTVQDTVGILDSFEFSRVHIFPYSNRPMTAASMMKNQLSPNKIKEYLSIVRKSSESSKIRYKNMLNGKEDFGIYEGGDKLLGQYYVSAIDSFKLNKSRNFVYKFRNGIMYAE